MKLYNTLTKKIEEFIPIEEGKVKMYTCGPTVYHYAHIGNLRTYIYEDILEKSFKYLGYDVNRVMNITDVGHLTSDADTGEDKMLLAVKREHKSSIEIAKYYTECFKKDCEKLNIRWPDTVIPATSMIEEYIKFIQGLEEKGYTYFTGGNVYFDTSKIDNYYELSGFNKEDLNIAVRDDVEVDSNKRSNTDFVLWFTKSKFENQELKWDSPWGYGYPGWHIECSVISLKYLGEYLDIHCGGIDNKFPHHTNEIAQTESYVGHKWCNYWFHPEHLNSDTGKMSKSKGEFLTVSLLEEKGYDPLSFRYMCLNSHYKKQLVFTFDNLDVAENAYKKLLNKISNIKKEGEYNKDIFDEYNQKFKNCISDNLNIANAISLVYDILKDDEVNGETKLKLIETFDNLLSLNLIREKQIDQNLEEKVKELIEKRNELKKEKKYEEADKVRDEILSLGVQIKDTREGVEIIWN